MNPHCFPRSILAAASLALAIFSQSALAQTYVEVTPGPGGVTASTHDGNVPANTVDNNLNTRWSAEGDNQWIAYDLGSARTVGYARIAVYQGNQRRNVFDIQTSGNGSSWTTIWSAESSGTTTQEQTYDFPDVTELSPQAFREAARVLGPGGRLTGSTGRAADLGAIRSGLEQAGFRDISVQYGIGDAAGNYRVIFSGVGP